MPKPKLLCPHCGEPLDVSLFAKFMGAKGGSVADGAKKARSREHYQKAAAARWKKYKAEKEGKK